MQKTVCEEDIIPFVEKTVLPGRNAVVLEIGCGTAGVLSAFLEHGNKGYGVDLEYNSLEYAKKKLSEYIESNQLILINDNIYSVDFETEFHVKFDIIILKDVIEHIHDQEKLLKKMRSLLTPSGVVFVGFPPWQMPFGGHQQICQSKILSHLPYFHLLPMPIYKGVLKAFKEGTDHLCELKETGISIERFEKLAKKTGYKIVNKDFYFINPIYKHKFNLKVRKQNALIGSFPYIRNFFTTCAFYLLQTKNNKE
jgi:2-polyprenyl-3-methyl-5-hydroxy-6-metoxy-1,4-benzoquinol methylase